MRQRPAFTLTELLVVVGIIGVLLGLILPAVQRVRESAVRAECSNNLHQVALATHQYHDTMLRFPAGMRYSDGNDQWPFMSWLAQLLPYLDQDALWNETLSAYKEVSSPFPANNPPHVGQTTVIKVFACPADPRAAEIQLAGPPINRQVALTSYLGVEGKDFYTCDGVLFKDSSVRMSEITDGTSRTLLAGERPPSTDFVFGWWYAGAGQQATGSADMVLGVEEQNVLPYYKAPCFSGVYLYGPGQITDQCDMFHFWSLHKGGANFAFADGSVRFLSYAVAPLMPALASRAAAKRLRCLSSEGSRSPARTAR